MPVNFDPGLCLSRSKELHNHLVIIEIFFGIFSRSIGIQPSALPVWKGVNRLKMLVYWMSFVDVRIHFRVSTSTNNI